MIDASLAKAIKELNKKVPLKGMSFLNSEYKPAKDFSIVLIEFKNDQRFEVTKETYDAHLKSFTFFKAKGS